MIRLLGPPGLEREGQRVAGPRGRKAWALLAYLVLAPRPPSRQRLVSLLFPDADDPLGALRWNLAELRRALGGSVGFDGDPVEVRLAADVSVDVLVAPDGPEAIATRDGELLEGLTFTSSPTFEMWLLGERRRVAAMVETDLYHRGLTALAEGRADDAASGEHGQAWRHVETALAQPAMSVWIRAFVLDAACGTGDVLR